MNLEARKIEFVKEFLNLQSVDIVARLEKMLSNELDSSEKTFEPMTKSELNKRIEKSESDFRNNRFKRSSELLTKYE